MRECKRKKEGREREREKETITYMYIKLVTHHGTLNQPKYSQQKTMCSSRVVDAPE